MTRSRPYSVDDVFAGLVFPDPLRPYFDIAFTSDDFNRERFQYPFKMILELRGLEISELRIRVFVLPLDGIPFNFDARPTCALNIYVDDCLQHAVVSELSCLSHCR